MAKKIGNLTIKDVRRQNRERQWRHMLKQKQRQNKWS